MAGYKIGRITQDIQRELSVLLRQLKDPRIAPMLSVIKVQVSNDLSHSKVYVSAVEGKEATEQSVEGLKSAAGFLKKELSNRLHLRKCPQLHFIADDSIAYGSKIESMLRDIKQQESWDEEET